MVLVYVWVVITITVIFCTHTLLVTWLGLYFMSYIFGFCICSCFIYLGCICSCFCRWYMFLHMLHGFAYVHDYAVLHMFMLLQFCICLCLYISAYVMDLVDCSEEADIWFCICNRFGWWSCIYNGYGSAFAWWWT